MLSICTVPSGSNDSIYMDDHCCVITADNPESLKLAPRDQLESWAQENRLVYNASKCQILFGNHSYSFPVLFCGERILPAQSLRYLGFSPQLSEVSL